MKDSLAYALHQLAFILDRQSDEVLRAERGFGYSQFKILMAAKHRSGLTQTDIASFLSQTEASVSRQIKIMVSQGLLTVKTDDANRRKHVIILTEKGFEEARIAVEVLQEAHASVFGSLSYKEQTLMKELIDRLLNRACSKESTI